MKILVAVKRVADANFKVAPNSEGSGIDLNNIKMAMNPFCEIAVEQAVRLKEAGVADEVVVVSVGQAKAQEQLRAAMALGADRALLVTTDEALEPLSIAQCLQAVCGREMPDLVLMGKQSIDGDNNQTGQMLAGMLDWPQATFASEIMIDDGACTVSREVDGGSETLSVDMPAVVTCDLRLNEPRFVSLPNIMKAKKKPLEILPLATLELDVSTHIRVLGVSLPPERKRGVQVNSVAELVDKLKSEQGVLA